MRISDWSSDVCSSDLALRRARLGRVQTALRKLPWTSLQSGDLDLALTHAHKRAHKAHARARRKGRDRDWHRWRRRVRLLLYARDVLAAAGVDVEIGRASCRERVCQYV